MRDTPAGREAETILRSCVHCGFCLATCPTYQLLGDELDSPRGRIYLIKQVLEGQPATAKTRLHLDRCLTCRACETTCPSGVRYAHLANFGRAEVERQAPRSFLERAKRRMLAALLLNRRLFGTLLAIGRGLRPLLPAALRRAIPPARPARAMPLAQHPRTMLLLEGCVQPALAPVINAAAARVLDRAGITLLPLDAGCCGALPYHLNDQPAGLDFMRRNIDLWWPHIERGAQAILITSSGCGIKAKEYGYFLAHDPRYAEKAARVSELVRDVSEAVAEQWATLRNLVKRPHAAQSRLAFHSPCTLQHGLGLGGKVEALLTDLGFELTPVPDAHLCCGSAGTYALLQPTLARQLRDNKVVALESGAPAQIASANIGCLTHLQSGSELRVRHWIELVDELLHQA